MKLVTFRTEAGAEHIGALAPGEAEVVDFTAADPAPHFTSMLALIDGGTPALDRARDLLAKRANVIPLNQVTLRAPVPEPRQMRDFLCFEKHWRQARARRMTAAGTPTEPHQVEIPKVWYEEPIYYKCNRFSVVGTGTDIVWPRYADELDYECEFGVFLGKGGVNIARDQARSHIFGYCIFNDVSARDQQMREMSGTLGPTKGKDFDTGNVMGPWLVTADEIPDPYALTMTVTINGERRSQGASGDMHHRFEDIIAHVSADETLKPGEFLGSGTVGGGCGIETGILLAPGDVVELEVQGLGRLRNRVTRPITRSKTKP
jgi:2-keto-4-pentenoate hydratase/2-oxohepta-3-ene-1,7-dioic acid hydratase in catechol pathway